MRTFLIGLAQLFIVTVGLLPPTAARAQGTWQWAQATNRLPGFTAITGTVMNRQGDTYLTGYAADALTLGTVTLPAGAFLICLDSVGVPRWGQRLDGLAPEPRALALDTAGGVYLAGAYRGGLQFGSTLLPGNDTDTRIFVAHCSSEGQWRWAAQNGNSSFTSSGYSGANALAIAPSGYVWVGGNYRYYDADSLVFGQDTLRTATGSVCGFIALLTNAGNWQRGWNLGNIGGSCRVQQISVDDGANAYVTGSFLGTLTLGTTQLTATATVSGFSAGFVARLSGPAGWRWARQWGTDGTSEGLAVAVDPGSQDPIVAGVSVGQVALDGHPVGGAWTSGLLGRLDRATGQWRWATSTKVAGGRPGPALSAMRLSARGRLYAAGPDLLAQNYPGLSFEGIPTIGDGRVFVVAADVATGAWQQVWRSTGQIAAEVVGLTTGGADRVALIGRYIFRSPNDSIRFGISQLPASPGFGGWQYVASLRDTRAPLGVAPDGAALRLQLWPNPATTTAQLTLPTAAPVALPVRVLDALGREVRRTVVAPGARTAVVPVVGLPPGCYWVRAGASGARLLIE